MSLTENRKKRVVNPRYAKSGGYRKVIRSIETEGKCPFCPENFKYHKHPILKESGGWFVTRSSWPYKNTKHHFVVIGKEHKEHFRELDRVDMVSVQSLVQWAIETFKIRGGVLAHRFGETDLTGATVCHLHFHLIVPKAGRRVNFPIG